MHTRARLAQLADQSSSARAATPGHVFGWPLGVSTSFPAIVCFSSTLAEDRAPALVRRRLLPPMIGRIVAL